MRQRLFFLSFVFFFLSSLIFAQKRINVVNDSAHIGDFIGKEQISCQLKDSIKIKNGSYNFNSFLHKKVVKDTLFLQQIKINGNYVNNHKEGVWNYRFSNYMLDDIKISDYRNVNLTARINGYEKQYIIRSQKGKLNGKSELFERQINNGRRLNQNLVTYANFKNDTLIGEFLFVFEDLMVSGKTDNSGFFDGDMEMTYLQNGVVISEKRKYSNGFLLELEKREQESNKLINHIVLDEVYSKLKLIKESKEDLHFKVSDEYFGLKFNIGYAQTDKRVREQLYGNRILFQHFSMFDSINHLQYDSFSDNVILKGTKRFEFIYDENDDSLAHELLTQSKLQLSEMDSMLQRPNFLLRKNTSENLTLYYEILKNLSSKVSQIEDIVEKTLDGYYKHRYRNKYFQNGIPNMNQKDSIIYTFDGDTLIHHLSSKYLIQNGDSLMSDIMKFLEFSFSEYNRIKESIKLSLITYDNQDIIDSLDIKISKQSELMLQYYPDLDKFKGDVNNGLPYAYKLIFSIKEKALDEMKHSYLNDNLAQEEMIKLGNEILCYYHFINSNHFIINRIENMKKIWNDSLFTKYEEHPFDTRLFETKVLDATQNAANILLTYYGNQLLNTKSCKALNERINQISQLNKRVIYLVNNDQTENVIRLNKTLRRERVPNRIERILEL